MDLTHHYAGARTIYESVQPCCACAGHSEAPERFGHCTAKSPLISMIMMLIGSNHQYRSARTIYESIQPGQFFLVPLSGLHSHSRAACFHEWSLPLCIGRLTLLMPQ